MYIYILIYIYIHTHICVYVYFHHPPPEDLSYSRKTSHFFMQYGMSAAAPLDQDCCGGVWALDILFTVKVGEKQIIPRRDS